MSAPLRRWDKYVVRPRSKVGLSRILASGRDVIPDKKTARTVLKEFRGKIDSMLSVLAAESTRSLLVVLQGVDTSGKDGAVRRVFTGVNPQYCTVVSFKEPPAEELRHDYLWRISRALPERGRLCIFNRSHYEDVLVPYARSRKTLKEAHTRLRQTADVERIWSENGTAVCKIFLHISCNEQRGRFRSRLNEPAKHWKVKASDFEDRKKWNKFQAIYEDVLQRTSTSFAPWYVVPADHKWYRDVAVAGIVLSKMHALHPKLPMPDMRTVNANV